MYCHPKLDYEDVPASSSPLCMYSSSSPAYQLNYITCSSLVVYDQAILGGHHQTTTPHHTTPHHQLLHYCQPATPTYAHQPMHSTTARQPDDTTDDGYSILRICSTMRIDVILSPYSNHEPSECHTGHWSGYTVVLYSIYSSTV
jgi:hypothetical protein